MEPKEIAQEFLRLINQHDVSRLIELFRHDAIINSGDPSQRPVAGTAAIRASLEAALRSFPDLVVLPQEVFHAQLEAVAAVTIIATMKGDNPNPAQVRDWHPGSRFSWKGVILFKISEDDRIGSLNLYGNGTSFEWLSGMPDAIART
ncbi:MAG: nuclear transport factor 2 family protein [Thermoplasmata archaeon]